MAIRARFYCESVLEGGVPSYDAATDVVNGEKTVETVTLRAIYGHHDGDPNRSYARATPSATVVMQIDNPDAWGAFRPGHIYDAIFTPTHQHEAA